MVKNAQKRTVRRRHEAEITYFVTELALNERLSAKAIARAVEEKFDGPDCPSARTVQDMVRETRSRPKSGPWQMWGAEPDDVAAVLRVLAAGYTTEISQEDADWIIKLSRAGAGDLPPSVLYDLSIQYQLKGAEGEAEGEPDERMLRLGWFDPVRNLDAIIIFTPWRSETAFEHYQSVIEPWESKGGILHRFPFGLGDYETLLRRLGFLVKTAKVAKSYDEALALEGGMPDFTGHLPKPRPR